MLKPDESNNYIKFAEDPPKSIPSGIYEKLKERCLSFGAELEDLPLGDRRLTIEILLNKLKRHYAGVELDGSDNLDDFEDVLADLVVQGLEFFTLAETEF
jgi:hypothetical protein